MYYFDYKIPTTEEEKYIFFFLLRGIYQERFIFISQQKHLCKHLWHFKWNMQQKNIPISIPNKAVEKT